MRLHDWPSRLAATVKKAQGEPFAWGANDCCLFVCAAIEALTGADPGREFRGRYDSALGGAKLAREICGSTGSPPPSKSSGGGADGVEALAVYMAERHGFLEVPVYAAQRGDFGLLRQADGDLLGVCLGAEFAFVGEAGLGYRPTAAMARVWRVG